MKLKRIDMKKILKNHQLDSQILETHANPFLQILLHTPNFLRILNE